MSRKTCYLIDGHNLIAKLGNLSLSDPDDEEKLIRRLELFAQRSRAQVSVVFDPGVASPRGAPPIRRTTIHVSFAPPGATADELIINRLREWDKTVGEVRVVTSDHSLANKARALGAQVMSSEAFAALLQPGPAAGRELDTEMREPEKPICVSSREIEEWLRLFHSKRRPSRRK